MKLIKIISAVALYLTLVNAGAAEITTCLIDTSIKSNPRVYFFPLSTSQLRCDHITGNTTATLSDLYEDNWRLIQVVNPVEFKQKDSPAGYTPVLLYLERTKRPVKPKQNNAPAESSYDDDFSDTDSSSDETSSEKTGGIFGSWFKGDKQEEIESE